MNSEQIMSRFVTILIKSAGGKIEVPDKMIETFDFEKYEIKSERNEEKKTAVYFLKEVNESIAHID